MCILAVDHHSVPQSRREAKNAEFARSFFRCLEAQESEKTLETLSFSDLFWGNTAAPVVLVHWSFGAGAPERAEILEGSTKCGFFAVLQTLFRGRAE